MSATHQRQAAAAAHCNRAKMGELPRFSLLPSNKRNNTGEKDLAAGPSWNVCGSLCTVNDILVKRLPLAGLAPGSVLAFGLAGAYCATEGAALFLSRDLPRVVLVGEDGRPALVREGLRTDPVNMPVAARG